METTRFTYSKFMAWLGSLFFTGAIVSLILRGFSKPYDPIAWFYVGPVMFVIAVLAAYFLKKCIVPAFQGRIALELDEGKLQFNITGRTIYWKDVEEVTKHYSRYSSYISFEMVDGSGDIRIPTRWVTGSNDSIYNLVETYFEKSL